MRNVPVLSANRRCGSRSVGFVAGARLVSLRFLGFGDGERSGDFTHPIFHCLDCGKRRRFEEGDNELGFCFAYPQGSGADRALPRTVLLYAPSIIYAWVCMSTLLLQRPLAMPNRARIAKIGSHRVARHRLRPNRFAATNVLKKANFAPCRRQNGRANATESYEIRSSGSVCRIPAVHFHPILALHKDSQWNITLA